VVNRDDRLSAFIGAMVDGLLMAAGPHPQSLIANTALRTDPTLAPDEVFSRTGLAYDTVGDSKIWAPPEA
jgi:hypothetical protein